MIRLAMLLAIAMSVSAQMLPLSPWWDSPIAQNLGLSSDQTARLRAIAAEHRGKLLDASVLLKKEEAAVAEIIKSDPVDVAKAREAVERSIVARGQLSRAVAEMSLQMRLVLTARQWEELEKRQAAPSMGTGRKNSPAARFPHQD